MTESESNKVRTMVVMLSLFVVMSTSGLDFRLIYASYITLFVTSCTAIAVVLLRKRIGRNALATVLLLSAWTIWPLINTLTYHDPYMNMQGLLIVLLRIIGATIFAAWILARPDGGRKVIISFCTVWALGVIVLAIMYIFDIISYEKDAFAGFFHDRNAHAATTVLVSFLLLFFSSKVRRRRIAVLLLLLLVSAMVSESVRAFLGVLLFLATTVIVERAPKKRVLASLLIVPLLGALLTFDSSVRDRATRLLDVELSPGEIRPEGGSARLRVFYAYQGFRVASHNLLRGVGHLNENYYLRSRGFADLVPRNSTAAGTTSHNNFVSILLSGGIPAFTLYYIPILLLAVGLYRSRKSDYGVHVLFYLILFKIVIDSGSSRAMMSFSHSFVLAYSMLYLLNLWRDRRIRIVRLGGPSSATQIWVRRNNHVISS